MVGMDGTEVEVNTLNCLLRFDGRLNHFVRPWQGKRFNFFFFAGWDCENDTGVMAPLLASPRLVLNCNEHEVEMAEVGFDVVIAQVPPLQCRPSTL